MADNPAQDALLEVDATVHELKKMDMDSTSNPAQESEEREERRTRKWENWRSNYDGPSRTYYREMRPNSIWSSQYHCQRNYGGYVSNQRWSHEYNRRGNSYRQSRTWYRDDISNTSFSNELPRQGRHQSDRADDVSCSDGHNRPGRHGSHGANDTTWSDEHIEDESAIKSERSSVYDNASISKTKPFSDGGKSSDLISMGMKQMTGKDGRFMNEQEQALERFSVRSKKSIEVSLAQNQREKDHPSDLDVDTHALHPLAERLPAVSSREKLLILDINGLLADIIYSAPNECKPDVYISRRAIFKRPFCHDFLKFCFERFHVGIWSSRTKRIIDGVVDYLLGDMKDRLLLCWDLSHCTPTKYKTLENKNKLLVFKELRKIWEQDDPDLPWKRGEYNESNTLLLDDSPYKALLNPMHSAIFPNSYSFKDSGDNSLGPEGDLRVYLQNLATVEDVQRYVEQHPFGQKAIDETDSNWSFYNEVISSCSPLPNCKRV